MSNLETKIISELNNDPRISLSQLAKNLNISYPKVQKMFENLVTEQKIKFFVGLNVEKLSLYQVIIFLDFENELVRTKIKEKFSKCCLVYRIIDICINHQMIIFLRGQNLSKLNNFLTYGPINYINGIKSINSCYSHESLQSYFQTNCIFDKNKMTTNCGINCEKSCIKYENGCEGCQGNLKNDN